MSSAYVWYSYQQVVPSCCCLQNPKSIVIGLEPTDVVWLIPVGFVRWYLAFPNPGLCWHCICWLPSMPFGSFGVFWWSEGVCFTQKQFKAPRELSDTLKILLYTFFHLLYTYPPGGNMAKKPETFLRFGRFLSQAKMQHEQNWMSQQLGQFMGHVEVEHGLSGSFGDSMLTPTSISSYWHCQDVGSSDRLRQDDTGYRFCWFLLPLYWQLLQSCGRSCSMCSERHLAG